VIFVAGSVITSVGSVEERAHLLVMGSSALVAIVAISLLLIP